MTSSAPVRHASLFMRCIVLNFGASKPLTSRTTDGGRVTQNAACEGWTTAAQQRHPRKSTDSRQDPRNCRRFQYRKPNLVHCTPFDDWGACREPHLKAPGVALAPLPHPPARSNRPLLLGFLKLTQGHQIDSLCRGGSHCQSLN